MALMAWPTPRSHAAPQAMKASEAREMLKRHMFGGSGAPVTESARDQLLQRLADAQREQEEATMGLIQLELDEILTGLAAAEDQAAAALRTASEALDGPLARLAEMDEGISRAEGRCVEWSEQLADADPDTRARGPYSLH